MNVRCAILPDLPLVGVDYDTCPSCGGRYSGCKMNENGQRLLELRTSYIANFPTKPNHNISLRHPRSTHWHQLDMILFRRATIKSVLHTRPYHSLDWDTDHSLVCVARSGCNQRRVNPLRNRGTPVLMLPMCHNQTAWHNLRWL